MSVRGRFAELTRSGLGHFAERRCRKEKASRAQQGEQLENGLFCGGLGIYIYTSKADVDVPFPLFSGTPKMPINHKIVRATG